MQKLRIWSSFKRLLRQGKCAALQYSLASRVQSAFHSAHVEVIATPAGAVCCSSFAQPPELNGPAARRESVRLDDLSLHERRRSISEDTAVRTHMRVLDGGAQDQPYCGGRGNLRR